MKRLLPIACALALGGCLVKDTVQQDAVAILSNAAWLAYQDGPARDWRVLVSDNKDTQPKSYALQAGDLASRYALAMVCPGSDGQPHRVTLIYAGADTVSNLRQGCEPAPEARKRYRLSGNIYDEVAYQGEQVRISFAPGEAFETFISYAALVPEGPKDLLAVKGPVVDGRLQPRRFVIMRLDTASDTRGNTSTTPVEDQRKTQDLVFLPASSLPAADPATLTVTPQLSSAEVGWWARVDLWSRQGNYLPLLELDGDGGLTQGPFVAMAADALEENEGHQARLEAVDDQGRVQRAGVRLFTRSADVHLALPAPFDPQPSVSLLELSWSAPPEDPVYGPRRLLHWTLEGESADGLGVRWSVYVADAWMEADALDGRIHLPLPDFSGLHGWQADWGPRAFDRWRLAQYFSDDPAGDLMDFLLQNRLHGGVAFGLVARAGP